MKIFFWLLIAVNVVFFAVMKFWDSGQVVEAPPPVHAEKIVIASAPVEASAPASAVVAIIAPASAPVPAPVSASAVAPVTAPPPAAPVMAKSSSCYEWGEFSGAELEQVSAALKKLSLGNKLGQREIDRSIGFWVYVPPLKDKAAAGEKVAQLKARGVTDYFVVQDAGEWQNAISLGVFKTRESAQNFLATLRTKGVMSAKLGERSGKSKSVMFIINNLDAEMSARLMVIQKDFAESDLKRVSCH